MALSRGARGALVTLGMLALLTVAVIAASPMIARHLLVDYLARQGVKATIGNIDVNLFSGSLAIDNAHGRTARGRAFDIGHLALSLHYLPLLSHRLRLHRLTLEKARIDVRRRTRNTLRVGGLPVLPAHPHQGLATGWGVGVTKLNLDDVRIDYRQAAIAGRAAVRRELTVHASAAKHVETWRPKDTVAVNADLGMGQSALSLKGTIKPFGQPITGDLDIKTRDFALDLIAPVTHRNGIQQLGGRMQSQLHASLTYDPAQALQVVLTGHAQFKQARLARRGGPTAASDRLNWQGRIALSLFGGHNRPSTVNTSGKLKIDHLQVVEPRVFKLTQAQVAWQGKTRTELGPSADHVTTDGILHAGTTRFTLLGKARLDTQRVQWQGHTSVDFAALISRQAKGRFQARTTRLSLDGKPLAVSADAIEFNGRYAETPTADAGALKLGIHADVDAHDIQAMDTTIDAPWVAAEQASVRQLAVAGLGTISAAQLKTQGLRVLGDTNTQSAVLQADRSDAEDFRLDGLRHYYLSKLDIRGAEVHLRHDSNGMGVLSRFFAGSHKKAEQQAGKTDNQASAPHASYAVKHISIAGPGAHFVDTTVAPHVHIDASKLSCVVDDLNTADPEHSAHYQLSMRLGRYGHFDSKGQIAPLAPKGVDMNLKAYMRSLPLVPLSGYLDAAMGRKIANGAADATLDLKGNQGQLDGQMDVTLSNFRLIGGENQETNVALGISLDTALDLIRSQNNTIRFSTAILGDITNPYFSMKNLTREAILAGLRHALTSDYSPLGLLKDAGKAIANIGHSLSFHSITFRPRTHYVPPDGRKYLAHVGTAMSKKPGLTLRITGHAVSGEVTAGSSAGNGISDGGGRSALRTLARQRANAVRDYLAARNIATTRLQVTAPVIDGGRKARPRVTLSLGGSAHAD